MGLRIRTNISSLQGQRQLGLSTMQQQESMERLASGYRINKSADDAAGLAISETLRGRIRSAGQATRNATDGISLIQTAEGGMNEITNILIRLKELAVQSSSDTIDNTQRGYTNREYTQLVDEVDRIANTTEFNGLKLFKGKESVGMENFTLHIGTGDGSQPNTDTILVAVDPMKLDATEALGLGKGAEIGPEPGSIEFNREDASHKISIIDNALEKVASNRATLGAQQSRLQSTINNLGVQMENMTASNSRIRDVDFASETAKSTQSRILAQAGVSVLAQANQIPELALALLR